MPTKHKILLVDDVQLILELEKGFLKDLPIKILTARNGQEALELVRQERPDLVYMDMNMPVMDGPTCCAAIKSDPDLGATPIIMVTTAGQQGEEAHCRRAGCDDFMTKPIDRQLFLDKVFTYIANIDSQPSRVACTAPVSITSDGEAVQGMSTDLSVGGMYVAADRPVAANSSVEVTFVVPGEEPRQVSATGRVAWENSADDRKKPSLPVGFGVEFTEIDPDVASFIKAFVDGTILKL